MARTLDYNSAGNPVDRRYYRHSNRVTADGVLAGVLAGLAVGLPIAIVYAYVTAWAQFAAHGFVYAVPGPVIFGAAIGFISSRAMRLGKVRSVPVSLAVVGATAAACYAIHWLVWCFAILSRIDSGLTVQDVLQDPGLVWRVIADGYEAGKIAGPQVQISMLVFPWLAEAALVLGSALYFSLGSQVQTPFCEKCGMWCGEQVIRELRMCDHARLRNAMESRDWIFLNRVGQAASVMKYISIVHHQCPCGALNTLSAHAFEISVNSNGEKTRASTLIVNKLLATPNDVREAAGIW